MRSVGPRCHELRIQDQDQTWRIMYRVDSDAVILLEVFSKKTQKTPQSVIRKCQQRLKAYETAKRGDWAMDKKTLKRLEAAGWNVGDASDFLDLTPEETVFIELKLALSRSLRREREKQGITQTALAKLIGSSQSRVAKMEAGDASVTADLLMRALLAIGLTKKDLSKIVAKAGDIAASV